MTSNEYERHFYQAYARLTDNKLVRLIWDWDDLALRHQAAAHQPGRALHRRDVFVVVWAVTLIY